MLHSKSFTLDKEKAHQQWKVWQPL